MLLRRAFVAVDPDEIGTRSSTASGVVERAEARTLASDTWTRTKRWHS
jgi:hypothetical protein